MFRIPNNFLEDDYIQLPILRKFCDNHNMKVYSTKPDLVKAICEYANSNENNYEETLNWAMISLKEGSKEFCYKKIYNIAPELKKPEYLNAKMKELYPNCPFSNLLEYRNTTETNLIDYKILTDENNNVLKMSLVFSQLVLEGTEKNTIGNPVIFPIFIDIYFDSGFIVGRAKSKATLYYWTESQLLTTQTHINTRNFCVRIIDSIIAGLSLDSEEDEKITKNSVSKMQFKLYDKYSFTPESVQEQIKSVKSINEDYARKIFEKFGLSYGNLINALNDLDIFVEKYISINGNNEDIFKNDREAYLIKVVSDDAQDMTKIDTSSPEFKPLQCTEAFFDSKKSIIKNRNCNKIHLCFKRENSKYFGSGPFCVQFRAAKGFGTFKTGRYVEEVDIKHVLQTIFENY